MSYFRDIVGQQAVKAKLIREVQEGKIPHARLICGPEGSGKLPLAIACARYIYCYNRSATDACGVCPSCVKFNKLVHPDLHFIFPVVKKKSGKDVVCDDYIKEWRDFTGANPYFKLNHWLEEMGTENGQAVIYTKESDEIVRKLSLKSSEGGYKSVIIWLPEKMKTECANKLLKLLEEPPAMTLFLLVTEKPDELLTTIVSRTQCLAVPKTETEAILEMLVGKYGLEEATARVIAHQANGDVIKAIEALHLNEEKKLFFDLFVSLMRLSYQRKIKEMKLWSEQVSSMGRERQKNLLDYCQRMIRENFIFNFRRPEIVYMNNEEQQFAARFAPFINERNIEGILYEISEAQRHIEQNVNVRIVFFDFALKMIVLLKQ
ncbi:MAG: DNA polymerase III subunit delta [Bacteroides sp.]|nr:DNA polymerase III subunit delta [Bacteroides sp.]